jgi:hypothetical protein
MSNKTAPKKSGLSATVGGKKPATTKKTANTLPKAPKIDFSTVEFPQYRKGQTTREILRLENSDRLTFANHNTSYGTMLAHQSGVNVELMEAYFTFPEATADEFNEVAAVALAELSAKVV